MRYFRIFIAVSFAIISLNTGDTPARAGKPDKGGSSDGGYTFVTLDARTGSARSWVSDVAKIGNARFAVGNLDEEDGERAVMWEVTPSDNGHTVATHYLAGGAFAASINTRGEAVGYGLAFDVVEELWVHEGLFWSTHAASPLSLSPLAGDNETEASAINAAGVIVGRSTRKYWTLDESGNDIVIEEQTAVAWRAVVGELGIEIRGPFVLGLQPGSYSARDARAINECNADGEASIAGITELGPTGWTVQCLANGGVAVLTGPYSLVPEDAEGWGAAASINNDGDSCGRSLGYVAFRRLADGTFSELATPRNAISEADGINDSRQVVGQVIDPRKDTYGALWQADGSRIDLNSYLGRGAAWSRIWRGTHIDSDATIAAIGALNDAGEQRALLMIAQ